MLTRWAAVPPVIALAVFFAWPVTAIISRGFELDGFQEVFRDGTLARVAWFTMWQATASTALTLLAALPLTFVLARYRFRGRAFVESALVVPFVLPTVVVGAAFLALLPERWKQSVPAILIAHVFFNVAVVVRTVTPLWRQIGQRPLDAAATLGATPWHAARTITWPMLRPALISAASIVFLFCFTSFGIVQLLGGPRRRTLEVEIYRRTAQLLDLRTAAALAVVQLVALAAALVWTDRRNQQPTAAVGSLTATDTAAAARPMVLAAVLLPAVAFFSAPLVALVVRAGRWSTIFHDDARAALWLSVRTAVLAALLATLLGGLAAVAIAEGGRGRRWLNAALILPLGTSAVTIGFGFLITFDEPPFDLRGSFILVPIAHALIGMPFVVRAAVPVLQAISSRQRDAAATLGASPWRVWATIDFPRLRRSLAVGFGFAFAISLGEFGASSFLARRSGPTLPILIGQLLGRPGAVNRERAYALALMLALVTALVIVSLERLSPSESAGNQR